MKTRKEFVSIIQLISLNILFPSCQREYISEHVNEIVHYQNEYFKKNKSFLFLGCLEICLLNGKYYCIDGQHRYHAMVELFRTKMEGDPLKVFYVWIEIIQCDSKEEMMEYFQVINKNTPLPDFIRHVNEPILILKAHIKDKYTVYLKNTTKPNKPSINIDIFLENLITRHGDLLKDEKDVIQWLESENTKHGKFLRSRSDDSIIKYIKKIDEKDVAFYLGCFWLKSISHKISKSLSRIVWDNYYKENLSAFCPCCNITKISINDFECGHIISLKNGGETSKNNLRPICRSCNQSMGAKNWDDFIVTLQ